MLYKIGFLLPIKLFFYSWEKSDALRDGPKRFNQRVNAEDLHPNDYMMVYNRSIPSSDNNLKNIYLGYDLCNWFS